MIDRIYNAWFVARRAEDLPDTWVAHCLDFDTISQGGSLQHALEMVLEATQMAVVHDLTMKQDPTLRRAPQAYFDELYDILETGVKATGAGVDIDQDRVEAFAVQVELQFVVVPAAKEKEHVEPRHTRKVPMAVARRHVSAPAPSAPPC